MSEVLDIDKYAPKRILICPDNYHAKWVGKTFRGLQFFITTPFVPAFPKSGNLGCEFHAVFLWEHDGTFREAIIDNLGPRSKLPQEKAKLTFEQRAAELGKIKITPISVAPFKIKRFDLEFGLIYQRHSDFEDNEDDVYECVELHPGNCMAFNPPWDGHYDT